MTETDMTENDVSYDEKSETHDYSEAQDNFVAAPPAKIKRGVGWGAILPLFLLSGLGGAIGGWVLTQYVMPKYIPLPQAEISIAPKVNLGPLRTRIDSLEKKLAAQSSEMSFLSSEIKSGSATVTVGGVDKAFDITPLMNRLNDLETRLEAQADGPSSLSPSERASVETGEILDSSSAAETSEKVMAAAAIPAKDYDVDIAALERRIERLEVDVEETRALAAEPAVVRETVLLPPFPRGALLEAMTAPRDRAQQNWLDKTLKKHISVRNPQEVARAEETLGTIEALVESGDYTAALKLVEAMPSDVRSAANDWTRALKAEIETRP